VRRVLRSRKGEPLYSDVGVRRVLRSRKGEPLYSENSPRGLTRMACAMDCEHGVCNAATGMCECDSGWGSTGDWATTPGLACDQNVDVIRGLGIACAAANFMALLYGVYKSYPLVAALDSQNPEELPRLFAFFFRPRSRGRGLRINGRWIGAGVDPRLLGPLSFTIASLFFTIYGVLKAVDPLSFGVGLDYASTFMAQLGTINAFFGLTRVNSILLTFCLKQLGRISSNPAINLLMDAMQNVVSL